MYSLCLVLYFPFRVVIDVSTSCSSITGSGAGGGDLLEVASGDREPAFPVEDCFFRGIWTVSMCSYKVFNTTHREGVGNVMSPLRERLGDISIR